MTTFTYTVSQGDLITAIFSKMAVFDDDSPPQTSDINTAIRQLNMFIKYVMTKNYNLWCYQEVTINLVQGQTTYLLGPGPSSAFATWRPLRIPYGRLRYANTNPAVEIPLIPLARDDYNNLGVKQNQGFTNSFYYDPQIGQGVLYLYLTPDATPNTVILTCQRPIADALLSTDPLDFPIEWNDCLVYNVAARLCFDYDVPPSKAARLEAKARELLDEMLDWDQEAASVQFVPSWYTTSGTQR